MTNQHVSSPAEYHLWLEYTPWLRMLALAADAFRTFSSASSGSCRGRFWWWWCWRLWNPRLMIMWPWKPVYISLSLLFLFKWIASPLSIIPRPLRQTCTVTWKMQGIYIFKYIFVPCEPYPTPPRLTRKHWCSTTYVPTYRLLNFFADVRLLLSM